MKAILASIIGLTLLGLTYLVTESEGKFIFDVGKKGGKVIIEGKSDLPPLPLKSNGCLPGEESNRTCDDKE